jgi:hypothetical protein
MVSQDFKNKRYEHMGPIAAGKSSFALDRDGC